MHTPIRQVHSQLRVKPMTHPVVLQLVIQNHRLHPAVQQRRRVQCHRVLLAVPLLQLIQPVKLAQLVPKL